MEKGRKVSKESRQKMSLAKIGNKYCLGRKISEKTRRKISLANKGYKHTEEAKQKLSKAHKGKKLSEGTKKKLSESHKGMKPTDETRRKISFGLKGKKPWNKGLKGVITYSKERNLVISQKLKGHKNWNTTKGWHHPKKMIQKLSKMAKARWKDSNYVKKQMMANNVKPNKLEIKFKNLLNILLPKEYKFVGDGQFILGGKCPDFMNINGQKKLIELYGDYWHKGQNPQKRINYFKKYGFKTLIIWEKEYKNNFAAVKGKLLVFNQRKVA